MYGPLRISKIKGNRRKQIEPNNKQKQMSKQVVTPPILPLAVLRPTVNIPTETDHGNNQQSF